MADGCHRVSYELGVDHPCPTCGEEQGDHHECLPPCHEGEWRPRLTDEQYRQLIELIRRA